LGHPEQGRAFRYPRIVPEYPGLVKEKSRFFLRKRTKAEQEIKPEKMLDPTIIKRLLRLSEMPLFGDQMVKSYSVWAVSCPAGLPRLI
jgi:hypothetical protein